MSNMTYRIKRWLYRLRAKFVVWLVGDIPVIINCTVYDDVLRFNFPMGTDGIAVNNKVKRFRDVALQFTKEEQELRRCGVSRSANGAIVLNL